VGEARERRHDLVLPGLQGGHPVAAPAVARDFAAEVRFDVAYGDDGPREHAPLDVGHDALDRAGPGRLGGRRAGQKGHHQGQAGLGQKRLSHCSPSLDRERCRASIARRRGVRQGHRQASGPWSMDSNRWNRDGQQDTRYAYAWANPPQWAGAALAAPFLEPMYRSGHRSVAEVC
jgi:hypothetical protein